MKNLDKLINILGSSVAYFFTLATFLSSLCLCIVGRVFPYSFLKRIHYLDIYNKYGGIIFIIVIVSFFFLIVQFEMRKEIEKQDEEKSKELFKKQCELFKDEEAFKILCFLYSKNPEAEWLSENNQKVQLLKEYKLIMTGVPREPTPMDPYVLYVLTPLAEEMMKKIEKPKTKSSN